MLQVERLTVRYGPVTAVRGASWGVHEGEIVSLLGPNGAGKTSTLNSLLGLVRPADGAVTFRGQDITRLGPEDTVRAGLVLCPEGRRVLRSLSVLENLGLAGSVRRDKKSVAQDLERMLVDFPVLDDRRQQLAGTLSGGEAQQLAIARALMARPRLLLLDEPTLGLAPLLVDQIFEVVARLRLDGLTVVLVDQNANRALQLADRTYVMRQGVVVASGNAQEIGGPQGLAAAYLGGSGAEEDDDA